MTRKRRLHISFGILAACVCLALGVLVMRSRPGATKANFDRIELGMTLAEVEAIIGRPAGSDFIVTSWMEPDRTTIRILLKDGRVSRKVFSESSGTIADMFLRWLHLS